MGFRMASIVANSIMASMAASTIGSQTLLWPLLCFHYGLHHKLYSKLYYASCFFNFKAPTTVSVVSSVIGFIMASIVLLDGLYYGL